MTGFRPAEEPATVPSGDQAAAGPARIEQDVAVVLHVERTAGGDIATVERIPIDLDTTDGGNGDAGSPRGVVT
jgi:hypothetical protein